MSSPVQRRYGMTTSKLSSSTSSISTDAQVTTVAGSGTQGWVISFGPFSKHFEGYNDGFHYQAKFNNPYGVVVDSHGNTYVR